MDIDRHARHRLLPQIGDPGQQRIQQASVLVLGLGALGSTQAQLLARAGVGRLRLVDRDVVERSNLHRQLLYTEVDADLGTPKAVAAGQHLRHVNREVELDPRVADLNLHNGAELLDGMDLVVDACDNFETRYLLNDLCVQRTRPWIYGGAVATEGMAMAITPGRGPCLRCLLPDAPMPGSQPTCDTVGVLNALPSLVASVQVSLALRLLVGDPEPAGRLHLIDAWSPSLRTVQVPRQDACRCCGEGRFDFLTPARQSWNDVLCGQDAVQISPTPGVRVDFDVLRQRLGDAVSVHPLGAMARVSVDGVELLVFEDGRTIVKGTRDTARARSLCARYLGV
ncbi:MAG: ThiF family adenylyltransferase [Pseudomonadota bacterium]